MERWKEDALARARHRQQLMGGLDDAALIKAMRQGRPEAWNEFETRFRPVLESYADRRGFPRSMWDECVVTVLDDAAMRFGAHEAPIPKNVRAYLVRSTYHQFLRLRRESQRRAKHYELAAREGSEQGVIISLCSEAARRDSEDPSMAVGDRIDETRAQFLARVEAELTVEERLLLAWIGEGVPRRQIADWLGVSYEAARKRTARLSTRARELASAALERMPSEERIEFERALGRVGHVLAQHRTRDEAQEQSNDKQT